MAPSGRRAKLAITPPPCHQHSLVPPTLRLNRSHPDLMTPAEA